MAETQLNTSKLQVEPYEGEAVKEKKRKRPEEREARVQANEEDVFDYPHNGLYNIWYDRVQDFSTWKDRRDAKIAGKRFKLDVDRDPGKTNARGAAYICLYFARGKCIQGKNCGYFHRLPTKEDEDRNDLLHDIFGRDRHRTEREDMGGVGSFNTDNKSLYVGGIKIIPGIEEIMHKHFSQFGEIVYLKVLHGRSICFIQYKYRACAEFAKEAMADQSIIKNEVLNVRWANEHPDAQVQRQREDKQQIEAWKAMKEKYPDYFSQYESLLDEDYPDPENLTVEEREALRQAAREAAEIEKRIKDQENEVESAQKDAFLKEVTDYMAWQSYYQSMGYPSYINEFGMVHYYDPALYPSGDAQPAPESETTTEGAEAPVASQPATTLPDENQQLSGNDK